MKIKALLLLAATLAFSMIKAQGYEIHSVDPDTLIIGNNTLTVTLNKEIVDYDSSLIHIWGSSFDGWCNYDNISWIDSIMSAEIFIPPGTPSQDVNMRVFLMNTIDLSGVDFTYDEPFYINEVYDTPKYNIQHIEPNFLIPGLPNFVTVTLDKEIAVSDSAYISVSAYVDGVYHTEYSPYINDTTHRPEIYWSDSTITAKIYIPDFSQVEKGVIKLEMINTNDWSTQILKSEDSLLIGGNIYSLLPEICMVSVDSSNRNMIIWEPDYEDYVDSIIVYKETSVADEFEEIGRISIEESPVFVDEGSENAPYSNRYKIAFQDTSGVVSKMSPPHKTMHLTMNVGINHAINLIWEKYEGFEYSTFHIYRGSSKGEMVKISEIASNLFTFSDLNPSFFKLYYQVVVEKPTPCDINSNKSTENIFGSTKSNIVEHTILSNSTPEQTEYSLNIYPNPATNNLFISIDNLLHSEFDLVIHDITGRSVQSHYSLRNGSNIDLSELKRGMYLLTVTSNGINHNKIFIKE